MAEIFETVDDLPADPHDGTAAGIRIPSAHVEHLVYHAAQGAWVGRQHWTMRVYQNEGIAKFGDPEIWIYPGDQGEDPPTDVHRTPHQFQIHKLLDAGQLWDAGLRLQEHLTGQIKEDITTDGPAGAEVGQVALAWYPLATGDAFLTPASFNHGVRLTAQNSLDDLNWRHCSSGWQNTTLDTEPDPDEHLYPEIYMLGPAFQLREFSARHRWAAGTLGGAGSGEDPVERPVDRMLGWYSAEQIYVPDSTAISEWGDMSGWGVTLIQPTSGKQPVVMSESGIRFVRFDGSNDLMYNRPMATLPGGNSRLEPDPPITIYMVMRQRAAGGTQQVWLGTNLSSGATLIYRGDATDQVNYWSGGSDATYHGPDWPTPWRVWSSELHADGALTIWEGATEVFTGTAGTTGFKGLVIGNNGAETLPAAIDVAELLWTNQVPGTGERASVVGYLEGKYGL